MHLALPVPKQIRPIHGALHPSVIQRERPTHPRIETPIAARLLRTHPAMFTLRCTKLLNRLKVKPNLGPLPASTRLGDRYADTLNIGRERPLLFVSVLTLLPSLEGLAWVVAYRRWRC